MSGSIVMSTASLLLPGHCPEAELLVQQHDVIQQLEQQHQSLQVMSMTLVPVQSIGLRCATL